MGGGESDYSVCPRPLLQFLQFFQFMSDRLRQVTQVTSGYIRLRQFTSKGRDVELDKRGKVKRRFREKEKRFVVLYQLVVRMKILM